mgnify:CR=1 FL=1
MVSNGCYRIDRVRTQERRRCQASIWRYPSCNAVSLESTPQGEPMETWILLTEVIHLLVFAQYHF